MSAITLTIKDETATGRILNELVIALERETVTIKDIIESRVRAEVNSYNEKLLMLYRGLVQPNEAESALNGYKLKQGKKVDAEKQIYVALAAFQQNGFFVLVDNRQAELLDEEVLVNDATTVSFVKLTPLVGG
jgi:hypothetical protein